MIIDKLLQFDSGLAITSTTVSSNVIDLGITGTQAGITPIQGGTARDIGVGDEAMFLVVEAGTAFSAGPTLTIALQASTNNSTWTTIATTAALTPTTANTEIWALTVPPIGLANRYLQLTYTVASGPFTTGTLTAQIVLDRQAALAYAEGINVAYV